MHGCQTLQRDKLTAFFFRTPTPTVAQAARHFGVNVNTIARWLKVWKIPHRTHHAAHQLTRSALAAFMAREPTPTTVFAARHFGVSELTMTRRLKAWKIRHRGRKILNIDHAQLRAFMSATPTPTAKAAAAHFGVGVHVIHVRMQWWSDVPRRCYGDAGETAWSDDEADALRDRYCDAMLEFREWCERHELNFRGELTEMMRGRMGRRRGASVQYAAYLSVPFQ